jgi:hypothetical protein
VTFRCRTKQRHTAGCPAREERISYPFHPRRGELVAVLGTKRHAGVEHLVIRQPDRTLTLLPAWMTQPQADAARLVEHPRLCLDRLRELRSLMDALLASWPRESPSRQGTGHEMGTTPPARSVRAAGIAGGSIAIAAEQTSATVAGVAEGSSRGRAHRTRSKGDQR